MLKTYTEELKRSVVAEYRSGSSVAQLCAQHDTPRSTIYFWIKQYRRLESPSNVEVSYRDYYNLKRRADKLEEKLRVIKASGCSLTAPLQEKLTAIEKLYGQFSVHTLCEALEVSRGTFYNHIFRKKKETEYSIRREEIREQVKTVFDESKQRFGSKKICAVLVERGVRTSASYVATLMQEMNLQSIRKAFSR